MLKHLTFKCLKCNFVVDFTYIKPIINELQERT